MNGTPLAGAALVSPASFLPDSRCSGRTEEQTRDHRQSAEESGRRARQKGARPRASSCVREKSPLRAAINRLRDACSSRANFFIPSRVGEIVGSQEERSTTDYSFFFIYTGYFILWYFFSRAIRPESLGSFAPSSIPPWRTRTTHAPGAMYRARYLFPAIGVYALGVQAPSTEKPVHTVAHIVN